MRIRGVLLAVALLMACSARAQEPLSQAAALAQLYNHYDAKTKTARLTCNAGAGIPWDCNAGPTVSVEVELIAQVNEDVPKMYVVTSAKPSSATDKFECHMCAPAIGVAVFAWKNNQWVLESSNPSIGAYGSMGNADDMSLVSIGWSHHAVMTSGCYEMGGNTDCAKYLLVPVGKTVSELFHVGDEHDDAGDYDPAGVDGPSVNWYSSAAIRFEYDTEERGVEHEYFDIEVISRGIDEEGKNDTVKRENWTEIYRFKDGKYNLLRHTDYLEVKKATRPVSK